MQAVKNFFLKLKEWLVRANDEGIPIPLIRDNNKDQGSLTATMFWIAFNVALLALIGKLTKYLGDIDYSNVLWLLGMTFGFWVTEIFGKRIVIDGKKIEVSPETKEEDKKE